MKRLTALFAALALTLSLTACAAPRGVAEDGRIRGRWSPSCSLTAAWTPTASSRR